MIDSVEQMLDLAADRLAIDMEAGYTEGYERTLAREVHDRIPEEKRPEILRWLIGEVVASITTGAVNLLDETDEDSYRVADEIAGKLDAAVRRQDHADSTLLHLITHEITEREHMARVLKDISSAREH